MRLNVGAGRVALPRSEGWVNADIMPYASTDEAEYQQVDVFAVPWPWATSSVKQIMASHIIEHIPHETRLAESGYIINAPVCDHVWLRRVMKMDGFFAFFAEAWRVLEPGGTIECIAPYGMSRGALQDPTHQRFIVETTINYLVEKPTAETTFDYGLPFTYELTGGGYRLAFRGECGALNVAGMQAEVTRRLSELWNQAVEIGFTLRAVKE